MLEHIVEEYTFRTIKGVRIIDTKAGPISIEDETMDAMEFIKEIDGKRYAVVIPAQSKVFSVSDLINFIQSEFKEVERCKSQRI